MLNINGCFVFPDNPMPNFKEYTQLAENTTDILGWFISNI
jgi:hypothetical protein